MYDEGKTFNFPLGHTKLINCSSDAAHLKIAKVKKNILIFFLHPHLHFCTAPTFFLGYICNAIEQFYI